jgi:peptidoglycan/LPS O-acetylase OafA/YrhL
VLFLPYARAAHGRQPLPTLAHFIDRRFIKIVPSWYFALLVASFLCAQPAEFEAHRWRELLRHALFVHTAWQDSMFSVISAGWSLGPEVQFYVLFPALAAAMRRWPIPTYLVLLSIAVGFRAWLHATGLNHYFYFISQLPAQLDLFGIGMLSAYAFVRYDYLLGKPLVQRGATVVAIVAFAFGTWLIDDFSHVTKTLGTSDHQAWQSDHRIVVGFTIAALTLGTLFSFPAWRGLVANPLLVWLSGISYNWYLWHGIVLNQCATTGFPCSGIPNPWQVEPNWGPNFFFTYVGVSLVIAAFITYGFERPLLRLGTRGAFQSFIVAPLSRARARLRALRWKSAS